ncbi:MAG: hypothetical protein AAF614_19245 [Chloroflexota bacterium]
MFFKRYRKRKSVERIVSSVADVLLAQGLETAFREKAKEAAATFTVNELALLRTLLHKPPKKSEIYDPQKHGLGGWISACQFAIFELVYHMGEEALPFVREIAWGEYDWTQGNAIELLIRFAAEGTRRDEIIDEIKENYPKIRNEAQLYAITPLIDRLNDNPTLGEIFERLMDLEEFKEAYDELTEIE